jgi:high-affinity iron transporter
MLQSPPPAPRRKLLLSLLALPLLAALVATAVWLATPGDGTAAETAVEVPPPPAGFALDGDADAGRELFVKSCAVCHGDTGAGDGKLSQHLRPNPGNLAERVAKRSDWQVYLTVRDGGTALGLAPTMVGFGERFSEQQIRDVAAYARSLAQTQ